MRVFEPEYPRLFLYAICWGVHNLVAFKLSPKEVECGNTAFEERIERFHGLVIIYSKVPDQYLQMLGLAGGLLRLLPCSLGLALDLEAFHLST